MRYDPRLARAGRCPHSADCFAAHRQPLAEDEKLLRIWRLLPPATDLSGSGREWLALAVACAGVFVVFWHDLRLAGSNVLAIDRIGSGPASQMGMIRPVSTIGLAAAFLGEPVTMQQLAGTAIVMVGVFILSTRRF